MNITIAVIIILIGTSLSLAFAFSNEEDHKKTIEFIAIIIGGGAAIYSASYAGIALRIRIAHDKVQHAHEFIHLAYSVDLIKLRLKLQDFDHDNIAPAKQYDEISKKEEVALALRASFNLFESLSTAIQLGHVDEVVAHRSLGFIVCSMYKTFNPYIDSVRKRNKNDLIYYEVERLAHSWDSNKYLFSENIIDKIQ